MVSQYFRPVSKMGRESETTLVGANFSSQMLIVCHFWENKVQWGIAINKLLVL